MNEVVVPRPQAVPVIVPPLLGFTAGFVDSCTVLALFGLFVAQVTGSFVLAAAAFVTHEQGAVTKVLAIPVFLIAAAATTALAVMAQRRGRPALRWAFGLECVVLTAFLIALLAGAPLDRPDTIAAVVASLLGLFAMGAQSATVRLLMRNVPSTSVMTTNTTQLAIDATELILAWQARGRAPADAAAAATYVAARTHLARLFPIMAGFLLGTVAGTLAYVVTGLWALMVPLAIMYAIFARAGAWRS